MKTLFKRYLKDLPELAVLCDARDEGLRYDSDEQRVYINASQHFGPVADAVWNYRIVTALKLTIVIQDEIDTLYPEIEKQTLP